VAGRLDLAAKLSSAQEQLLFDPQTSGGLLLAVAADQADSLLRDMREAGIGQAAIIGRTRASTQAGIRII